MSTADDIREVCGKLQQLLLEKNEAYGDSIFDPVHVFSSLTPAESIRARLDDKISRWKKGKAAGEDTEWDLAGYSVLLLVAQLREKRGTSSGMSAKAVSKARGQDELGVVRRDLRDLTPDVLNPVTWDEFCDQVVEECATDRGVKNKLDLVQFIPYSTMLNSRNGVFDIKRMASFIVVDAENVPFERIRDALESLGADAIAHGTPSDKAESDLRKLRVYVRTDRGYAPNIAALLRQLLAEKLGADLDSIDESPIRAYWCGRLTGTPVREAYQVRGGKVDVDALVQHGEWRVVE